MRDYKTIDIMHGTGLETNHVRQLVVYILYSAMLFGIISYTQQLVKRISINGEMPSLYIAFRS